MHTSIHPILMISPALSPNALRELQKILGYIARGAFGPACVSVVLNVPPTDASLSVELTSTRDESQHAHEITSRLAITMLDLIRLSSRPLGVRTRSYGQPNHPSLQVDGLALHHIRQALARFLAMHDSPIQVDLACSSGDFALQIKLGQALGSATPLTTLVCDSVIRRRFTRQGEVVRIRSGRRVLSVIIPRHIHSRAICEGTLIATTPIVGAVCRRLAQASPCQMNLFAPD